MRPRLTAAAAPIKTLKSRRKTAKLGPVEAGLSPGTKAPASRDPKPLPIVPAAVVSAAEPTPSAPTAPGLSGSRIRLTPVRPAPPLPALLFAEEVSDPPGGSRQEISAVKASRAEALWVPATADPQMSDPEPVGDSKTSSEVREGASTSLPANYASGSVWLVARDPFVVVAHWDFAPAQLAAMASSWGAGGWQLRLHRGDVGGRLVTRRALHAASGETFLPVIGAAERYVVELGYQLVNGRWFGVAMSAPVVTPREITPSESDGLGAEVPVAARRWAAIAPVPTMEGVVADSPEDGGWLDLPAARLSTDSTEATEATKPRPTEESPGVTASLSAEFTRMVWRVLEGSTPGASDSGSWTGAVEGVQEESKESGPGTTDIPAPAFPPDAAASTAGLVSSAELAAEGEAGSNRAPGSAFWLQLNAELILYGSTERNARVTIAGRPVTLREDGSFSFRFILPEGDYQLPVVAVDATAQRGRNANLRFLRETVRFGDVAAHPQDPALLPPVGEAIG